MKKIKASYLHFVYFIVVFNFIACTKNSTTTPTSINGIYVVGYQEAPFSCASLWKDSISSLPIIESNQGCLYSVFVTDSVVYMAGRIEGKPTLFQNNQKTQLSTRFSGIAQSVYVFNKDVYVAGYEFDSVAVEYPAIWKNGIRTPLSNNRGAAHAVYVSNSNVYVCGEMISNGFAHPTVWVNGVLNQLTGTGFAQSVFVDGNDVYVVGSGTNHNAVVWKNGIQTILGTEQGWANSVFVKDNVLYIAGREISTIGSNTTFYPTIWINGNKHILSTIPGDLNSVFVSDSTIYAAGYENSHPAFWVNNNKTILSNNTGRAISIFVKK